MSPACYVRSRVHVRFMRSEILDRSSDQSGPQASFKKLSPPDERRACRLEKSHAEANREEPATKQDVDFPLCVLPSLSLYPPRKPRRLPVLQCSNGLYSCDTSSQTSGDCPDITA